MSNYPDGVTDAHEHFNPAETLIEVECTTEEALVVPTFAVKEELDRLREKMDGLSASGWAVSNKDARSVVDGLAKLLEQIEEAEREGDYECQWKGEKELPVSEEAEWVCPRCGQTQTSDTIPEDRDPDEGWDRRGDD